MNLLSNKQIISGEIADYYFENGILVSLSKPVKRTVENITANRELVKSMTNNTPMPLLIFLCDSPIPDKATRQFSTEVLPEIYSAMGMVSKPGLAKFIMNILFALKPPPIPMKTFTNEIEARKWLKSFKSE